MEETALNAENPPAWRMYLAYTTVALMPLSFNIEKHLAGSKSPVYISPLDFLLPVLFLLLLMDLARKRPWAAFKIPPIPGVIWAALAFISIVWSAGFPERDVIKNGAKAALNPLQYGLIGVWVFQNLSARASEYRKLTLIFGASFCICLLLALKQYVGPQGAPYDPSNAAADLGGVTHVRLGGWYDYRGVLGAQIAMIVPAAVAFALMERDIALRIAACGVALVGLCVTLAGGGFIGACAGTLAVAGAFGVWRRNWIPSVIVFAGLAVLTVVVLPRLPRHNPEVLFRNIALFAKDATDKSPDPPPKPTARLRRYQAALDLLGSSDPWKPGSAPYWQKGAGSGQYQKSIDTFYQNPYPKPGRRGDEEVAYDMEADERFSWGFLETSSVELGIPGLLAITLLFATWIGGASGAFANLSSGRSPLVVEAEVKSMLALAAFGAGTGAVVMSIFLTPMIRGVGGSFAFFFALALCSAAWAAEPARMTEK